MIFDRVENQTAYPFGKAWKAAFDYIKTVTPDTATGKYPLQGDGLFAIMDSYSTKVRTDAKLETHRKYIDIQVMISGEEVQEIFPAAEMTVSTPYIPERDVEFYRIPQEPGARITLRPGDFAVYFPHDAHMPCLTAGSTPQPVKKAVVKVAVDLLI